MAKAGAAEGYCQVEKKKSGWERITGALKEVKIDSVELQHKAFLFKRRKN